MPTPPTRLSAISDLPALDDHLGFGPYAQTLADIVADPGTQTQQAQVRLSLPA